MAQYNIKFIHKISPRSTDCVSNVELPDNCFADTKTLGKALRDNNLLFAGERVRQFRVEGDKVVAFPGGRCVWHSIIIQKAGE